MLEFRPHHFLCTVGFQGKGYSPEFVKNYTAISTGLKGPGNSTMIRVVSKTDSICAPCPSKRGDLCESQAKIETLDNAHAAILGIQAGDEISWGEAKMKIAQRFNQENFEHACAPCSWKALGVCETALIELKKAHLEVSP